MRASQQIIAILALASATGTPIAAQHAARTQLHPQARAQTSTATVQSTSPFRITTDEFWLNLHHFLYVLGRAEGKAYDAGREAVRNAPANAEQGFAQLSESDRAIWREAVSAYAANASKKDAVADSALAVLSVSLVDLNETSALPRLPIDTVSERILRRAAPVYAKGWWPAHRAANRAWADTMRTLVDRHGSSMLAFIKRAYRLNWPSNGYPIRVAAFSNWAGAYSTFGDLLVVSSFAPSLRGDYGLETMFHEAMHQWDNAVIAAIDAHARSLQVKSPANLSHMLIFFTAGEATRSVLPQHVPYADAFGIWDRGWRPMHGAIVEIWKPYLMGNGELGPTLSALVKRLSAN